jgi:tRNA threonylcarbamoyladenosine biosynthesis protein TsaB
LIDELLQGASVRLEDIAAFAVSIGPGSFTGLRIGLATVKGLAFPDARPVAAVSTLAALCASAGGGGPTAALLDARRGALYAACVSAPGRARADLLADCVATPADLAGRLPRAARVVVGEGAAEGARALARNRPDLTLLELPDGGASAASVARLGALLLAAGEGRDARELAPAYLRRAEAEAPRTGEPVE